MRMNRKKLNKRIINSNAYYPFVLFAKYLFGFVFYMNYKEFNYTSYYMSTQKPANKQSAHFKPATG